MTGQRNRANRSDNRRERRQPQRSQSVSFGPFAGVVERIGFLPSGRLGMLMLAILIVALIAVGRLVWLQVIDAQNNIERDGGSMVETVPIEARRGTIYDRNGDILATTVDAVNVYCHPHAVKAEDVDDLANALAETFGGDAEKYREKITVDANFSYLQRGADVELGEKIKALGIEGVDLEETSKRVYPHGSTASQIIGILNTDGEAISGIELYYDDILGGTPGEKKTAYSLERVPVPGSTVVTAEMVNGQDIVLSIDIEMQERVEQALLVRVEEIEGETGSAILMDASTGEIYACASAPTFNITDLSEVKEGATNLSGISSSFEPGSIFKPVVMLAALEAGTTTAGQTYYCPEVLEVDEYEISDSHDRPAMEMDTTKIMAESSNVGMSLIAEDMGFETMHNAIIAYQIVDNANIDYPGSISGRVSDWNTWSKVQGYNISFGQGVEVTPLEMTRFYGALTNDGIAVTPHFLLDVPTESEDRTYETVEIISNKEAISDLTTMLEAVVEEGTGTKAKIKGFRVAGKTGTAEIPDQSGGYKKGVYDISFVGYLPDASLNLVCFVGATDVPGERQTVPAFQDIMSFAIERYNITQK